MRDDFTYIPTAITKPKHAAIREAWLRAAVAVCQRPDDDEKPAIACRIADECKAFADAITSNASPSDDTSAAIRCVRLAQVLATEALRSGAEELLSVKDGDRLRSMADDELLKARAQASAAIELHECGG